MDSPPRIREDGLGFSQSSPSRLVARFSSPDRSGSKKLDASHWVEGLGLDHFLFSLCAILLRSVCNSLCSGLIFAARSSAVWAFFSQALCSRC